MTDAPDFTPSGHPILDGRQQLTARWAMTLPFRMARRIEDGSLVFWAPGGVLTVWLSVFGLGGDGPSREERLAEIEHDRSVAATGVRLDRYGPVWRMSYRLGERADDDRADAFYGFAFASEGYVQFAAYFDDEATAGIAERTFLSLDEERSHAA